MINKKTYEEIAHLIHDAAKKANIIDKMRTMGMRDLYAFLYCFNEVEPHPEAWREEYTRRQMSGEKFDCYYGGNIGWKQVWCNFNYISDTKERFRLHDENAWREVPQEPHAAERALWKAQRDAGTNEVWQVQASDNNGWWDLEFEPEWSPKLKYRVKPMKLTAKILQMQQIRPNKVNEIQAWDFTGTREEYRAECEKYGYIVVSEIKEVVEKPKTVKYYSVNIHGQYFNDADSLRRYLEKRSFTIIGDIEEREVEI